MPAATVYGSPKMRGKTMVKTYREVAIEQMILAFAPRKGPKAVPATFHQQSLDAILG